MSREEAAMVVHHCLIDGNAEPREDLGFGNRVAWRSELAGDIADRLLAAGLLLQPETEYEPAIIRDDLCGDMPLMFYGRPCFVRRAG